MKIIEQTTTQLTLADWNQQWLWGTLFSIPFIGTGLTIALMTSNITTLECQRSNSTAITCQRTIAGLAGTKTEKIPERLLGASVIKAHGTGVVLSTSKGQVELANHRMPVTEAQSRIADTINAYVKDPQHLKLKIAQDDRWQELLYGAAFFLPGVAVLLKAMTTPMQVLCNLDRTSGQMTLEKRYRPLGTKFMTQYPLTDLQKADVVQPSLSERHPWFVVQLELTSAQSIMLSPPIRDRQQCQTIADTINQFLATHPT